MVLQSRAFEYSKGNNALNNSTTVIEINNPAIYGDWAISDMFVQPTTTEDFEMFLLINGISVRTIQITAGQTLRYINLLAELTIKESLQLHTGDTFMLMGPTTVPAGLANVRGCVFVTGDTL